MQPPASTRVNNVKLKVMVGSLSDYVHNLLSLLFNENKHYFILLIFLQARHTVQ